MPATMAMVIAPSYPRRNFGILPVS
jgi:hypothetical protein